MTGTEIAAWWGAVLATLVLAWDIYKYKRTGPIIRVSASKNMQTFGSYPDETTGKLYVVVNASNSGDRSTTITHLVGYHYKSIWARIRRKSDNAFFVPTQGTGRPLPHVLPPGEEWLGMIEQEDRLVDWSQNGYLYCGVHHSSADKPVLQRVIIDEVKSKQDP